jgi:uncharacterized protein (TIGR03437 family)
VGASKVLTPAAAACIPKKLVANIAGPWQNFSVYRGWPTAFAVDVSDDCGNQENASGVVLSFSNGDAPMAMTNLGGGRWSATWAAENVSDNMSITATATSLDGQLTGAAVLAGAVLVNPKPVPTISTGGVVNAASFGPADPLAPGSFVSIFGTALADKVDGAKAVPLPLSLAGASVQIGGKDAPVYYVNEGQINAIVPYGLQVDRPQSVVVKHGSELSFQRLVSLTAAAPGIFAYGDHQGIIVGYKKDGSSALIDASHPVSAQDVIVAYCTGLGEVDQPIVTGSATPLGPLVNAVNTVTMTIGGVPANVGFAGLTPGSAALYQVNATVPAGIAAGDRVPVILKQAGQTSVPVYISVR